MKLSCLSLSYRDSFSSGKVTLESFIETCYGLRLESVDLHASHFRSDDSDYLLRIKRTCLRRGLDIACLAISNDFGKNAAELRSEVDKVQRWISAAARLGAPLVRVFAGWAREGDEQGAWKRTVESLRECAAFGEEAGISVALQNHNHKGLTQSGKDILRMVYEVNHRNLTHVLDTGQYIGSKGSSGADPTAPPDNALYESIEQTAPLAVHVRAKIYRISGGQEEWLDYPRIFKILDGTHYNGAVSIVYEGWANEHEETGIPRAIDFLRRFVR